MQHSIIAVSTADVLQRILQDISEKPNWIYGKDRDFVMNLALSEIVQAEGKLLSFTKSNQEDIYLCRVRVHFNWLEESLTKFLAEEGELGVTSVRLWKSLHDRGEELLKKDKKLTVRGFLEDLKKNKLPKYGPKSEYELFDILGEWFGVNYADLKPYKIYK